MVYPPELASPWRKPNQRRWSYLLAENLVDSSFASKIVTNDNGVLPSAKFKIDKFHSKHGIDRQHLSLRLQET
jgi:hypothetical protein